MSNREGSLEAPTRHPIDWRNPQFYDHAALEKEQERIFEICHGCRRCVSLCGAFPTLFDLIDEGKSGEIDGVAKSDYGKVVDQCYLCDLCYMTKCPYVPPHPWNVDFPHLMLRAKAVKFKDGDVTFRDKLLTSTDKVGKLATIPVIVQMVNKANATPGTRKLMESTGRWDYIFSCIKKFRSNHDFCLADRALVTMTTHFMKSYAELLIKTCHRRNIHAMGGMAAQIPVKNDEKANAEAFAKVKVDKEREATYGHDGTWVAHPGLVPVALEAFNRLMPAANQIATKKREDVTAGAADLIRFEPEQPITEKGLRLNINVAIQYIGAWLAGQGAVPIYNLMEDAATAEISRSQVWQWMRSPKGKLDDGRKITREMVAAMIPEELQKIRDLLGAEYGEGKYDAAAKIFADLVDNDTFVEFLTLPAYDLID